MIALKQWTVVFSALLYLIPLSLVQGRPVGPEQAALHDTTKAAEFMRKGCDFIDAALYDSSRYYYERAKGIFENLASEYRQDSLWEKAIHCYNEIGYTLLQKGEIDTAIACLQHALKLGRRKLGDHPRVATTYQHLGSCRSQLGEYDTALRLYNISLKIRRDFYGEKHPDVGKSYMGLGVTLFFRGDYDRALKFYKKALAIKLELSGEKDVDVTSIYINIGALYVDKGDSDHALEFYNKALALAVKLYGEKHWIVAIIHNNIGYVYFLKRDYDEALKHYNQSLAIDQELFGESHLDVARTYSNLGLVYAEQGDLTRALNLQNKALLIRKKILGDHHPDVAEGYFYMGQVYMKKDNYKLARQNFHRAISIESLEYGKSHPDVANTYRWLAESYLREDDLLRALKYCQKGLSSLLYDFDETDIYANPEIKFANPELELLSLLRVKATAFDRRSRKSLARVKNLQMALSTYQLAADVVDKIRIEYKTEGAKLTLADNAFDVYDNGATVALELYETTENRSYLEAAFDFAERSKAGILIESLQESEAKSFAGIPDSLLARERQLRIDLAFYKTQLQKEKQKKEKADPTKIQTYENRYFESHRDYKDLIKKYEETYPRYYELKYRPRRLSLSDLQQNLDAQTTLIEYLVGEESIFIFIIGKDYFTAETMRKDSSFIEAVERFRWSIEDDYQQYLSFGYELYRFLIKPVEKHLQSERFVVIPDHFIAHIPFEAFLSREVISEQSFADLPYLLRKYEISYVYSADLLDPTPATIEAAPRDLLAFAPVFGDNAIAAKTANDVIPDNNSAWPRGSYQVPLPASREEVLGIQQLFRDQYGLLDGVLDRFILKKTRVFLGKEADEETLKNESLQNYRYLHFATHAFADKNISGLSGLLLAHDPSSPEDDILFLREIYTLTLNADLVSLSACGSGLGKLARGEGLIGLSRGFLYAGARNLLVTLWSADDFSTRDLMLGFYKGVLSGKPLAQALRQAKLQLIESELYASPYYWAPFVLIGLEN